jgi:signal peptidase I
MIRMRSFPLRVRIWALLVACSVILIMIFLYQPVRIEGSSMAPLLSNHEAIFINRIVYDIASIQRGDVVVFEYPLDSTKSFIKRVVALPGETVETRRRSITTFRFARAATTHHLPHQDKQPVFHSSRTSEDCTPHRFCMKSQHHVCVLCAYAKPSPHFAYQIIPLLSFDRVSI